MAPTLISLHPTHGDISGGTALTLIGTNFAVGGTSVDIGGNTVSSGSVSVNGGGTRATCSVPSVVDPGTVAVSVTTINGTSNSLSYTYTEQESSFLQNAFMSFADSSGDVQLFNIGNTDNDEPIYFELETQEIDFGNRMHLKKASDQIVVFTQFGSDSTIEAYLNGELTGIPVTLERRVNIGNDINFEGNYFSFVWKGSTTTSQPVLEGIYLANVVDLGMTKS